MTQLTLIKQRLQNLNYDDIINTIYHDLKTKKSPNSYVVFASKSMRSTKEVERYLYALFSGDDFCELVDTKHRFNEFLEYLYEAVGFSKADYVLLLEACRERKRLLDTMSMPYIFINTNFIRKNEPIFALAFMESKRRIKLKKSLYLDKNEEEIRRYVIDLIKVHYKQKNGELVMWGKIRSYVYHDVEDNSVIYSPEGIEMEDEAITESRATLRLK